jgi:hypothetical protein
VTKVLGSVGDVRELMVRWWHQNDEAALLTLLQLGAQYSGTRSLRQATAAYAEYLVCTHLGGQRLPQSSGIGDCRPPTGRVVEVKSTIRPVCDWTLQYAPGKNDYALVRFNPADWRVIEAWFVPMGVAKRHALGMRFRLRMKGSWRDDSEELSLGSY